VWQSVLSESRKACSHVFRLITLLTYGHLLCGDLTPICSFCGVAFIVLQYSDDVPMLWQSVLYFTSLPIIEHLWRWSLLMCQTFMHSCTPTVYLRSLCSVTLAGCCSSKTSGLWAEENVQFPSVCEGWLRSRGLWACTAPCECEMVYIGQTEHSIETGSKCIIYIPVYIICRNQPKQNTAETGIITSCCRTLGTWTGSSERWQRLSSSPLTWPGKVASLSSLPITPWKRKESSV
jgi:hypothetical protein